MARRILQMFWWLLLLGILTIFIFLGLGSFTSHPVLAALTQQEEAPGEILYRSQQRLNDASGESWQVVLFKRVYPGHVVSVNLRLVGYPGSAIARRKTTTPRKRVNQIRVNIISRVWCVLLRFCICIPKQGG